MSQSAHAILKKYAGTKFSELHEWWTTDLLDLQQRIEEEIQRRAELAAENRLEISDEDFEALMNRTEQ
jgi:hypothetical protein